MVRVAALATLSAALTLVIAPGAHAADYSSSPRTTTWSPTDGRVYAIERIGNTVYIGGTFTTLRNPAGTATVARARLAAFDADTGALLPWNPGADADVRALQASTDGTGLFVGGNFTTIAGAARSRVAEVDPTTGALVTAFQANTNGQVNALDGVGSRLYIGGAFGTVKNAAHSRLAAVDQVTGNPVPGFAASADASVLALSAAPDGSRVIAGGRFTTLSGQSRDFAGAVNGSTGAATSWRPPIPCTDTANPCYVLSLAQDAGSVYAGVGGPGGRVVAWDAVSAVRRWAAFSDGDVQAVAVSGNTVYAGGHFAATFNQDTRAGLAALSTSTGGVLAFAPQVTGNSVVWALLADPNRLRVAGEFNRINGSAARARYAEFDALATPPDVSPPTVPQNLRTLSTSDTIVTLAWNASTDDTAVSGYRLVRDGTPLVTQGVTTYTDRDLTPSSTHTYQVQATDAAGNWSALSAPLSVTTQPPSTSLVKVGSAWRYLSDGSDQGTAWRQPAFNDNGWSTGNAQLGFGDGDESTVVSPLGLTSYFRQRFQVTDRSAISALTVRLLRDDGAVVYLNGTEVMRSNMPTGTIGFQTPAASDVEGAAENTFVTQSIPTAGLVNGTNTIAVEVHNRTGSADLSFDLELVPTFATSDTQAPTTPANLHTTAVTTSTVGLAWNAATDNVGVTGYRIARNGTVVGTVASPSFVDSGLTPGATYSYTVTALDAAGNASPASTPVSVTLPTGTSALIATGDVWRHFEGQAAPAPWATLGFDDSGWAAGPSQLGFGDGDEATVVRKGGTTFYFRKTFNVADPSQLDQPGLQPGARRRRRRVPQRHGGQPAEDARPDRSPTTPRRRPTSAEPPRTPGTTSRSRPTCS